MNEFSDYVKPTDPSLAELENGRREQLPKHY